jgi:WhiB family redox-sensing transcriptional regulator
VSLISEMCDVLQQPWRLQAACRGVDPELFYPVGDVGRPVLDDGVTPIERETIKAKAVCARCDVRQECLDYAILNGEEYGVWGGLTYPERKKVARARTTMARRELQRLADGR